MKSASNFAIGISCETFWKTLFFRFYRGGGFLGGLMGGSNDLQMAWIFFSRVLMIFVHKIKNDNKKLKKKVKKWNTLTTTHILLSKKFNFVRPPSPLFPRIFPLLPFFSRIFALPPHFKTPNYSKVRKKFTPLIICTLIFERGKFSDPLKFDQNFQTP